MFDLITPTDLGLPSKFTSFRKPQREALEWLQNDCLHQISAACLPTGAGKTLIANTLAKVLGVKATYLVATKALQQQITNDFASTGMADIRGRANYACPNYGDCDTGADSGCSLSSTVACPYTCAVQRAQESQIPVTNYAYWLHSGGTKNRAFAGTELLICDEAHALESQLAGYAAVKLYASELGPRFSMSRDGCMSRYEDNIPYEIEAETWRSWATKQVEKLEGTNDEDEQDFAQRCKRLLKMNRNWVWQFDDRGHVTFEPVRLAQFSRGLFGSIPRVLLMSASLNEFTLKLLIPSDVEYDYRSWGSVFPAANAPVYHIPTVKLSWKSTDEDYKQVIQTADRIIDDRTDRKAIMHTHSYARTRRAIQHSRHADRFIWNENTADLTSCLERFRSARTGAILVTPSVEEAFDFPMDQCEYQILLKFPFPNETQRVIKERCAQIPGYRLHSAAQKVAQIKGRPIRSNVDRSELFILDNSVKQLCGPEGRSYCPPGFRIFTVTQVPPAPPKLQGA